MTTLTVWHDGGCPPCRREIALMRRLDVRRAIRFVDVADAAATCPIDRRALLARFHASENSVLLSDAEAFAAMWRAIPLLRPLGLMGQIAYCPCVARAALSGLSACPSTLPAARGRQAVGMRPRPDPVCPGQESVWDYPRPAVCEPTSARIVIQHHGVIVADTTRAIRTLETSHPPSYYIPPDDIAPGARRRAGGGSFCEWKGSATYWDVIVGTVTLPRVGWSYASPTPSFASLRDHVAFYAGPFDRCTVDGELVTPQPGSFYGGWITANLGGPFKGGPGSMGW